MAPPRGGEEALTVLMIAPGNVAEEAGMRVGDRILRINGDAVSTLDPDTFIAAMRGSPLTLLVDRDDALLTFVMSLDGSPPTVTDGGERPRPDTGRRPLGRRARTRDASRGPLSLP